jgi:hypothetical protein
MTYFTSNGILWIIVEPWNVRVYVYVHVRIKQLQVTAQI